MPSYPPQSNWAELVCGVLGLPAAIYTYRSWLRRKSAAAFTLKAQAITLVVLGLLWWLLYFLLFAVQKPVSKDAEYADILAFLIVGPIPVLMGLHFAFKIHREQFSLLYASAIVLALSPLLMLFFLLFFR